MKAACFVFTCCCCFVFVFSAGSYHGHITPDSRLSVEYAANKSAGKYLSSNSGKLEVKKIEREYDDLLHTEIQRHCKDLYTCVQLKMLANVSDILRADTYNLTENVMLERVVGSDKGDDISRMDIEKLKYSDNESFGYVTALLVQKTIDIFKTHSLKWSLLPGMDVRIFRNLNYGGRMDVALEIQDRGKAEFFTFKSSHIIT